MIIFAIDALEYNLVHEFNCKHLRQEYHGKTDISEFSEPRTMVLWSSFMTGENKETAVLQEGREMWNVRWPKEETFFSSFKNPVVIDLPGYSYDLAAHEKSRELLKAFFMTEKKEEKERIRQEYNKDAFAHHKRVKAAFEQALEEEHDLVVGYFSLADVIGHLNFGKKMMMRMIYHELDEMAGKLRERKEKLLILSDHGMKGVGMFGDHSEYGFWSTNFKNLGKPKITDFRKIIEGEKHED